MDPRQIETSVAKIGYRNMQLILALPDYVPGPQAFIAGQARQDMVESHPQSAVYRNYSTQLDYRKTPDPANKLHADVSNALKFKLQGGLPILLPCPTTAHAYSIGQRGSP
jgi:hypothetical protein